MTTTETPHKPLPLRARWNADMSITLYAHHTKVAKFASVFARQDVDNYCEGWFGTTDKTQWRIRWTYVESKKKVA